jgi:hypothetical protein
VITATFSEVPIPSRPAARKINQNVHDERIGIEAHISAL